MREQIGRANRGQKRSAETCARVSAAVRESWRDPEVRARTIAGQRGNVNHAGHPHTIATRARISAKKKAVAELQPERIVRGERSPAAKLTEVDVLQIRAACASGEKQATVARRFGIKDPQVSYIVNRKSWRHI
jgi:hypothetical protein